MARQANLLPVEEARGRILARFSRLEVEEVPLDRSLHRVLGADVTAPLNLPPFANSSMDGFALEASSVAAATPQRPSVLRVTAHVAAGSLAATTIAPGACARIMTGAPLPSGTNAVVPFEEVEDRGESIAVFASVSPGSCVRPAGNDVTKGEVVLHRGTEIGPMQIGLLGALGCRAVPVVRCPEVPILSTGNELVSPGRPLRPGQIFNSNTPMLAACVTEAGGHAVCLDDASDDPAAIAAALASAPSADLILTSGGASVGDFDHVKDVVRGHGELSFWRVRVRPGKPLLFGSIGEVPVIGLPGNPTSALVTFEQFVRPAIRTMLGAPPLRPEIEAIVDEQIDNHGGRRTYARVRLRHEAGRIHATLSGLQDSAMLLPLARAQGLLMIPEDVPELMPGDVATVQVWELPSPDHS